MSRWIPWEQLAAPEVLWTEAGETVRAVRDRLRDLGGRTQYNAWILIQLPDGRVAPTSAPMLRKQAQETGVSILDKQLADLLASLCPEPWSTESVGPEHQAARNAATARQLPVIGISEDQPAGLAEPGRGSIQPAYARDGSLFDLFDNPVPDSLLAQTEFVSTNLDATVGEVVGQLQACREPERAFVIVARDDGSRSVTRRKLDGEIKEYASQAWNKPLRVFSAYLTDAQTHSIKALGQQQATALAQRNLVVLADEENQVLGLMPPAGTTARGLLVDLGGFDLFDRLLAEVDPSELDLIQPEFVAASLQTPVIQVSADLQELPKHGQDAYVVVEREDGTFGTIATANVNQQLRDAGEDVWDRQLGEVLQLAKTYPNRPYKEVGYGQAKTLVQREKFLILTAHGRPLCLFAASAEPTVLRSQSAVDICKPPESRLEAHRQAQSVEEGLHEGLVEEVISMAPPTASARDLEPEPEAEQEPRVVNTWFRDGDGDDVPRQDALIVDQTYHLCLNIGQAREESILPETAPGIHEPVPETPEGTPLYASVFSDDFEIPQPTQRLLLPPAGDSLFVEFEATPTRRTFGPRDRATIEIHIYYHCNRVQSWQLRVEVVPQGMVAESTEPQQADLRFDRTGGYLTMQEMGPRRVSITIDRARDEAYRFDVVVAEDEAGDEVQLGCRINLRREDLTHLITKARRQMYNITQAYQTDKVKKLTEIRAFQALALLGRQLYNRLFEMDGPESSAKRVGEWLQSHLPPGSVLQVIDRAHDFVFPWNLVYDKVPWDENGMRQKVDVEGFWGWRFQIELMTEDLQRSNVETGTEIEAADKLRVGVGLNGLLSNSAAQRKFFEEELVSGSGDEAVYTVVDRGPDLIKFLRQGDQHILYVFCHGFTEKMATDIQIGDDLVGEFRAWLRTLPTEERAKLQSQDRALFDVSDSWIKLSHGEVPLTMMEYYAAPRLDSAPLVFLNMCESAQVLPSLSGGFIPFFIKHGARGVIGTECPMTTTFAHPFAKEFFGRFLRGQSVGQILWEMRRESLARGNPLGLAYTLYCDANLKLQRAVLQ